MTTIRDGCRVCGSGLDTVLDLGRLAISTFPRPGDPPPPTAPLDLCQCAGCGLVQLRDTVDPDVLFRQYWYRSGINETMQRELRDVVEQALARVPISDKAIVLDVGANDGTLLEAYRTADRWPYRVAVEPATNLIEGLRPHAECVHHGYFPDPVITARYAGHVAILTSIACFYDLDDPAGFVAAVAELLTDRGAWIVQFQDLHSMLQATAFDNLCHEHLIYYSLAAMERLVAPFGLQVTHAEHRAINGGSVRLIIQRSSQPVDETVASMRAAEAGCEHWHTLEQFAWRVGEVRRQLQAILEAIRERRLTVDAYGASTKGNTLLQVLGLGPDQIRQVWERSEEKWGRQTITGIPIVPEGEGRGDPPDLLLCLIWQFREAVLQRENEYLKARTMLFPLPEVDLVEGGVVIAALGDRP